MKIKKSIYVYQQILIIIANLLINTHKQILDINVKIVVKLVNSIMKINKIKNVLDNVNITIINMMKILTNVQHKKYVIKKISMVQSYIISKV